MKELIKNEPIEQEKNPLKWFREHKSQYPLATRIYLKYASIQATSVPSERVFNIASMTFDDCPLLLPEKAEKTVILSDYYRRKDGKNNYTLSNLQTSQVSDHVYGAQIGMLNNHFCCFHYVTCILLCFLNKLIDN